MKLVSAVGAPARAAIGVLLAGCVIAIAGIANPGLAASPIKPRLSPRALRVCGL